MMLIDAVGLNRLGNPTLASYTCAMRRACWKKAMLSVIGTLLTASLFAQQPSPLVTPARQFEVVALKESAPDQHGTSWHGRFDNITIQNYTLRHLILIAYNLKSDTQILGGPDWIDKSHFDISAKIDEADATSIYKLPFEESQKQIRLMLQSFLADRFQLKLKQDERSLPVYFLVEAKSGAKITAIPASKDPAEAKNRNHGTNTRNGHLVATAISMDSFADYLTSQPDTGDRVVLNRTGLNGEFDFTLNWTEDRGSGIPSDAQLPGLFTALQDQMGLTLKSDKSPVPVVEIESASRPQFD